MTDREALEQLLDAIAVYFQRAAEGHNDGVAQLNEAIDIAADQVS
jgi:hypothetical protein